MNIEIKLLMLFEDRRNPSAGKDENMLSQKRWGVHWTLAASGKSIFDFFFLSKVTQFFNIPPDSETPPSVSPTTFPGKK